MSRLAGLLALALPVCVVAAVLLLPPGWAALPLVGAAAVALRQGRPGWSRFVLPTLFLALAAICALGRSTSAAMLYPVVVNLALLTHFWRSLGGGPSAIETLARLAQPGLPDAATPYLRGLTKVWCAFFLLNATAALFTVLHGDHKVWALYNGLISYVLVGTLIIGERLARPFLTRDAV